RGDRLTVGKGLDGSGGAPAVGDEPACRRRGVGQRMGGDVVAMGMADDRSWPWLSWIEPQALLGKIDAGVPQDRVRDQRLVLLGRGGAFEELVAKRAIRTEALPGRSGKDSGLLAGGTGLFLCLDRTGHCVHRCDLEERRL